MHNILFSFKHITSHPAIVDPNILRVIKYGQEDSFETHYVHINDFNRYNSDQPEDGILFEKWLSEKAPGHPLILVDGCRVKELRIAERDFKAVVFNKISGFKEVDLQKATTITISTAQQLKEDLKAIIIRKQELALEAQVSQMIANL